MNTSYRVNHACKLALMFLIAATVSSSKSSNMYQNGNHYSKRKPALINHGNQHPENAPKPKPMARRFGKHGNHHPENEPKPEPNGNHYSERKPAPHPKSAPKPKPRKPSHSESAAKSGNHYSKRKPAQPPKDAPKPIPAKPVGIQRDFIHHDKMTEAEYLKQWEKEHGNIDSRAFTAKSAISYQEAMEPSISETTSEFKPITSRVSFVGIEQYFYNIVEWFSNIFCHCF